MKKQNLLKKILSTRGMGGALTAFAGLIVIYIAFGIINPTVFSGQNIMNLLRSMSKYLLIGIGYERHDLRNAYDKGRTSAVSDSDHIFMLYGDRCIKRAAGRKMETAAVYRNTGHYVCGKRRGLHCKRKQKYGCHYLRHR